MRKLLALLTLTLLVGCGREARFFEYEATVTRKRHYSYYSGNRYQVEFTVTNVPGYHGREDMRFEEWAPVEEGDKLSVTMDDNGRVVSIKRKSHDRQTPGDPAHPAGVERAEPSV
jgi:hypothetical protein